MNNVHDHDQQEEAFRNFSNSLLAAEDCEPLAKDGRYSRQALERILSRFCDIIAEAVDVESCTVHLKLYDSESADVRSMPASEKENEPRPPWTSSVGVDFEQRISDRVEQAAERHQLKPAQDASDRAKEWYAHWQELRKNLYKSQLTFPYPFYPKGAVKLVAANKRSPWQPYKGIILSDLRYGITQDIIQDKVARIRDRFRIRVTRHMKKLGSFDPYVWTNCVAGVAAAERPPLRMFFNYYGVPIRFHQGGEVVGLLRVENKNLFSLTQKPGDPEKFGTREEQEQRKKTKEILREMLAIPVMDDPESLKKDLLDILLLANGTPRESQATQKPQNPRAPATPVRFNGSWLSLAYLITDLTNSAKTIKANKGLANPMPTIESLCCIPYPVLWPFLERRCGEITLTAKLGKGQSSAVNTVKSLRTIIDQRPEWTTCLLAPDRERPPVQIAFKNMEQENTFLGMLKGVHSKELGDLADFDAAYTAYIEFNDSLKYPAGGEIKSCIRESLRKILTDDVRVSEGETNSLRPFYHKYEISHGEKEVEVFIVLLPSKEELRTPDFSQWDVKQPCWNFLQAIYLEGQVSGKVSQDQEFTFAGEEIVFKEQNSTDLLTDRLAARVTTLSYAFPVLDFEAEDARRLSWAALEIGKLIERQISYRGNQAEPIVPLTAMDFHRIPISDLCFVDAFRKQYSKAEDAKRMLEYHLRNLCVEMGFDPEQNAKIQLRIKNSRSYFERLGEQCEARWRALITTWLFLLSCIVPDPEEILSPKGDAPQVQKEKQDFQNFLCSLKKLKKWALGFMKFVRPPGEYPEEAHDSLPQSPGGVCPDTSNSGQVARPDGFFQELQIFIDSHHKIVGDIFFLTPVFAPEKQQNPWKFLDILARNLCKELPTGVVPTEIGSNGANVKTFGQFVQQPEVLERLILRYYEPYFFASVSLLVQLINREHFKKKPDSYSLFYGWCRDFVYKLCNSDAVAAYESRGVRAPDSPESISIQTIYTELANYCSKYRTSHFETNLSVPEVPPDYVHLTREGIFKRIRMLFNVLGNQVPPELLNWYAGRFDYVGARVNCLFKMQVFAVYEQIWNAGDPFFRVDTSNYGVDEHTLKDPPPRNAQALAQKEEDIRQRWCSLRTNIAEGEDGYNAWHITALVDPGAMRTGHWSGSLYTLTKLRDFLGLLHEKCHPEMAARYRALGDKRNRFRLAYLKWFKNAKPLMNDKPILEQLTMNSHVAGFGRYLGQTAIDFLIWLLRIARSGNGNSKLMPTLKDYLPLLIPKLRNFIFSSIEYSRQFCKSYGELTLGRSMEENVQMKPFKAASKELYKCCRELITRCSTADPKVSEQTTSLLSQLDEEERFFLSLTPNDLFPIAFLSDGTWKEFGTALSDKGILAALHKQGNSGGCPAADNSWLRCLENFLITFQREQKMYVFNLDRGLDGRGHARNRQHVLEKILNYVLLFDRDQLRCEKETPESYWTAYDLFYYLMSLVPAEIQIRTAIADTVAEQYHGIYKTDVTTESNAAVQRIRMQEIGRKFEEIDREMEVQFEDFVSHKAYKAELQE